MTPPDRDFTVLYSQTNGFRSLNRCLPNPWHFWWHSQWLSYYTSISSFDWTNLFCSVANMPGMGRIRRTAYYSPSHGLIECFYFQLKAGLISYKNPDWCEILTVVLLGIITCLKAHIQCSVAELVLGTTLWLPGECFTPRSPGSLAVQT